MNLLLLSDTDRVDGTDGRRFRVTDRRHQHLITVLKVAPDQSLRVGLWDGPRGRGRVLRVDAESTELQVEWTDPPAARSGLHLVLAVPRPKSLKKLLPEVVALGIGRLTLLRSWRVAQPYLSSPMLQSAAQRPLIADGLMQAGCTRPPVVELVPRFQTFVDTVAPRLDAELKLVGHPRADRPLKDIRPAGRPLVVAIGPEGGWTDYELEAFARIGFESVTMGPRVLRVETACVAMLSNLTLLQQLSTED